MSKTKTELKMVQVGMVGLGTVGCGVWKNLEKNRRLIELRLEEVGEAGISLNLKRVAVSDLSRAREVELPEGVLVGDWQQLIDDPEIQIIVELMGGTTAAFDLVKAALEAGKVVVTGNKALLAERGIELLALAEKENVPLYFEAAVAGGIPIIKAVRESLVGNRIEAIHGIINGTCNYILTSMTEKGWGYEEALKSAMDLGYAEADPTLDVSGWDAAHKAIVLAWLSYGYWIEPEQIYVRGIQEVDLRDIEYAKKLGYRLKLLSVVRQSDDGLVEIRTEPSFLPEHHILAHVRGVNNALAVCGDVVGETLYYGSGAGQDATSSAVIADLADAASNIANEAGFEGFLPKGDYGSALPVGQSSSQYYLRVLVLDQPGVIEEISRILAEREIGISSMLQPGAEGAEATELVMLLHHSEYQAVEQAAQQIELLDSVTQELVIYRVEELPKAD